MGSSLKYVIEVAKDAVQDPHSVAKLVEDFNEVLQRDLRKHGKIILLDPEVPVVVVGDLHGDLNTLSKILGNLSQKSLLGDSLRIVFLGDYIDRGENQLETILAVMKLKVEFPEQVFTLRGNHEPPRDLIPYPHDFPTELSLRFGVRQGRELYEKFLDTFDNLPLAVVVKGSALLLHGGLPKTTYQRVEDVFTYLTGTGEKEGRQVLEEILWNDPIDSNIDAVPSPRGAGYLFGKKITNWVLSKFKLRVVVRGHEACNLGFKFNHNGRVLTIFSRVGAPYFNESAAYAVLDFRVSKWWERLRNFIVKVS